VQGLQQIIADCCSHARVNLKCIKTVLVIDHVNISVQTLTRLIFLEVVLHATCSRYGVIYSEALYGKFTAT